MTTEQLLWDAKFENEIDVLDYTDTDMEIELAQLEDMTEDEVMLKYNVDSKEEAEELIIDSYK